MIKLSLHQEKILLAVAKKANQQPDAYLLGLLLDDYKRKFNKNYLL
jgi:hypothetical protein